MSAARRSARIGPALAAAIAVVLSVVATPPLPWAAAAAGDGLQQLRGRARPVVILSDRRGDPRVAQQKAALAGPGAGERDIVVLSEDVPGGALHRRLAVGGGLAVVLIGKDGDVKTVWRESVASARIFSVIDAMPMRRQEMKR